MKPGVAGSRAELDLGGGFSYPGDPVGLTGLSDEELDDLPVSPMPAEYAAVLASTVRRELVRHGFTTAGLCLEIEPGRAIYATAGLHLARVVNVKEQRDPVPRTWIETDTSEAFLPDVNLERVRWPTILPEKGAASPTQTADVVGCSCGFDLLVPDARLPEVTPGDLIALLVTGAYQDAGANNFNALPRPATVLVSGAQAEVIKRRETIAEVFARDIVPERLGGAPQWESDTAVGAPPLDTGSAAHLAERSDRDRETSPSRRARGRRSREFVGLLPRPARTDGDRRGGGRRARYGRAGRRRGLALPLRGASTSAPTSSSSSSSPSGPPPSPARPARPARIRARTSACLWTTSTRRTVGSGERGSRRARPRSPFRRAAPGVACAPSTPTPTASQSNSSNYRD